jgi:hypothetical protein
LRKSQTLPLQYQSETPHTRSRQKSGRRQSSNPGESISQETFVGIPPVTGVIPNEIHCRKAHTPATGEYLNEISQAFRPVVGPGVFKSNFLDFY